MPPDPAELQRNYKEFLDLLPLTLALAGMPPSQGRYFTEDQIEARQYTLKHAHKIAKSLAPDSQEAARNYKEFLDLLPLAINLAGLPVSEPGKYYTAEQIEARSFTFKHACKGARAATRECIQPSAGG